MYPNFNEIFSVIASKSGRDAYPPPNSNGQLYGSWYMNIPGLSYFDYPPFQLFLSDDGYGRLINTALNETIEFTTKITQNRMTWTPIGMGATLKFVYDFINNNEVHLYGIGAFSPVYEMSATLYFVTPGDYW